jgi:hypothetical protein
MQVFPSLHPGSSTPRIQKGGTEPRRWPPNSFGGPHAFVMVVARITTVVYWNPGTGVPFRFDGEGGLLSPISGLCVQPAILFEVLSIPCFLLGAFEIGWLVLDDSLLTH